MRFYVKVEYNNNCILIDLNIVRGVNKICIERGDDYEYYYFEIITDPGYENIVIRGPYISKDDGCDYEDEFENIKKIQKQIIESIIHSND